MIDKATGKVVLYIAMSLDGYIADSDGGVDWLRGQTPGLKTQGSYPAFYRQVDTVIMGYTTYRQIVTELSPGAWAYEGKPCYVFTHRKLPPAEGVTFVREDPAAFVRRLQRKGGVIWICGGANLAQALIRDNTIDRYHITVIPTLLGKGIRLFEQGAPRLDLRLLSTQCFDGMVDLVYERRSSRE